MAFGDNPFRASPPSLAAEMAERRIAPLARLLQRNAAPANAPAAPVPNVKKGGAPPTVRQVHGHLNNAKRAATDGEKRTHVFKALSALNKRQSVAGQAPGMPSAPNSAPADSDGAT